MQHLPGHLTGLDRLIRDFCGSEGFRLCGRCYHLRCLDGLLTAHRFGQEPRWRRERGIHSSGSSLKATVASNSINCTRAQTRDAPQATDYRGESRVVFAVQQRPINPWVVGNPECMVERRGAAIVVIAAHEHHGRAGRARYRLTRGNHLRE